MGQKGPAGLLTDTTLDYCMTLASEAGRDPREEVNRMLKQCAVTYNRVYVVNYESDWRLVNDDSVAVEDRGMLDKLRHGSGTSLLGTGSWVFQNRTRLSNVFLPLVNEIDSPEMFINEVVEQRQRKYMPQGGVHAYPPPEGESHSLFDWLMKNQIKAEEENGIGSDEAMTAGSRMMYFPTDYAVWDAANALDIDAVPVQTKDHISGLQRVSQRISEVQSDMEILEDMGEIGMVDFSNLGWERVLELRENSFVDDYRQKIREMSRAARHGEHNFVKDCVSDLMSLSEEVEPDVRQAKVDAVASNVPLGVILGMPANPASLASSLKQVNHQKKLRDEYGWVFFAQNLS